ncbi:PREDICTED: aspartate--tRNA ligase, mitochondrial [Dufourea novaeangliae]|uniref:aspartate--tRNA ligase, mitochondrial n=1 Tax=Dufourea novaeangliae TaxID=178035 RepID=UPI00076730F1|nr:PREDICTED: aspartate--tRNA ligase, mitochondrial [Dufourea novaeangliae]
MQMGIAYTHNLAMEKQILTKQNVQPVNKFVSRTHTCGELNIQNVGDNVHLYGWLEFQRLNKFITLRDAYGSTQLMVPDNRNDLKDMIKILSFESILHIIGTVFERPKEQKNSKMKTGEIEVHIESLKILNQAKPNLPIFIREFNKATESNQMKYRYLSLRYPELQRNLRLRSEVIAKMREYLIKECNFVDIETPTLFKSTPGGAQEFVVPTQHPGQFYSLVQSPQQFKQLLMVGGFDRYFQVARCYRDETARHDRQPEFTQLDIEMSFVDCEGIMELIENLLVYSWPEESEPITSPFKRLKFDEAMELYGSDKPDLRIPYQLHRLTDIVDFSAIKECLQTKCNDFEIYALVFPNQHVCLQKNYASSVVLLQLKVCHKSSAIESNKIYSILKRDLEQKLNLKDGDVLFLACGQKILAQSLLGRVRVEFTDLLESKAQTIRTPGNEMLWVTDFPLFSFNSNNNELETMHHPFTQPHPDDIQYFTENPKKVRGLHYDLVMNGSEIAGGSIRIHNSNLQKQILTMLNIDASHLVHMLDALESGAPPHGGIALGLDRLMSLLCKTESIRSVIAFPKTTDGRDMMSGAPTALSDKEKALYRIQTIEE